MPESLDPKVTMVAFWPNARGDAVESVAIRFGPTLSHPVIASRSSREEPRLRMLAGYAGFAMTHERPAPDGGRPQSLHLWRIAPAPRARTSSKTEAQS
jgi:hypothetical protein